MTTKYGLQSVSPGVAFIPGSDPAPNYELGIRFTVNKACDILGVRVMTHGAQARTSREAKLWGSCAAAWASGTLAKSSSMPDNPTADTYVDYMFSTPYAAAAGERCVVSYDLNGPKDYCEGSSSTFHSSAITTNDGYITFPVAAPCLLTSGADSFPTSNFSNYGYGVDVIYDTAVPTTLTNYNPAQDGVGYWGPFISSAGNVYIFGKANAASPFSWGVWKATDPTQFFTLTNRPGSTSTSHITSAYQVGDIIHCVGSGANQVGYQRYNMATDSWQASELSLLAVSPANYGGVAVPRAAGSDVIAFINVAGVVSMSKSYGRVAAFRSVGGTAAFGAATQIGLLPTSTALQTESVGGAVLGTSDRVHLFWNRTALSVGVSSGVMHRTVKSTDNLNGTAPATAEQDLLNPNGGINTAVVSDIYQSMSQPVCSATGVLMFAHVRSQDGNLGVATATSADTPTWSSSVVTAQQPLVFAMGTTTKALRSGGAQWDGTNKVTSWQDNSFLYRMYDKDTGSGWGTDTTFDTTNVSTADMMSSNVYTRGTDVVLASVGGSPSSGAVKYNEVVLRTSGLAGSISPVTITLTPQALATSVGGTATTSITPVTETLTPVALTASEGTVTRSISPVTITLTPVAISAVATIPPQNGSITPVTITLTPQALAKSVGGVTATITPASITIIPVALTESIGGVSGQIGMVTLTLTPVALTGQGSGTITRSISPVTITLTPVALVGSGTNVTASISPVVITLTPIALAKSVGGVTASISPVTLTETPVALTGSGTNVTASISPVTITLTTVVLTKSVGTVSATIGVATISLTPVALTASVGGTAASSISPVVMTINAQTLTGTSPIAGTANLTPAIFTVLPQALTKSVGGVTASISPATFTLTPVALAASEGTVTRSISPVTITLTPVALTKSVGNVGVILTPVILTVVPITLTGAAAAPNTATLTPVTITLTPVALTKSVGGVTRSISPVVITIIPVALTESIGGVSGQIGMVTITLTPVGLTASVGAVTADISPVQMMLLPMALVIGAVLGGKIKVWNGIMWVDRPIKVWTGSGWVEKPLKVWTGSTWALA